MMHRRSFLRNLALSPAILGSTSFLSMLRSAYAANGKTLIVVFQRGGCDGLNTVIPFAEDEYYSLRPDIAIAPPSPDKNSAIELNGFFGLHPSLKPFNKIYQQGDMAIFPAVHYPHGNRSHFVSQDLIESGNINVRMDDGWLNRYLAYSNNNGQLNAVSLGKLSHSMEGPADVITIKDLSIFKKIDDSFISILEEITQQKININDINRNRLIRQGSILLNNINTLLDIGSEKYTPSNGAVYPQTNFGIQMRQAAQLVKSGIGLELIATNSNSWDTHVNQGGHEGTQAQLLSDFSTSISALYHDLGSEKMNDVVILTMTEFGRTAKQNASGGTDHGNAASWFVIGGDIKGGIYGDWPGLQKEDLYLGRYLRHTIDFRDVFSEVISSHLDKTSSLGQIFPNYVYKQIGFF